MYLKGVGYNGVFFFGNKFLSSKSAPKVLLSIFTGYKMNKYNILKFIRI